MCHTKASLRLPLVNAPITSQTSGSPKEDSGGDDDEEEEEELRKESSGADHMGLPTPSCTGSMDSLSSSSCSDRQMASFTAKDTRTSPQSSLEHQAPMTNVQLTDSQQGNKGERDEGEAHVIDNKRISDSTDEDSGIENISRRV